MFDRIKITISLLSLFLVSDAYAQAYFFEDGNNRELVAYEVSSDITDVIYNYMGRYHRYPQSKEEIIQFLKHRNNSFSDEMAKVLTNRFVSVTSYDNCIIISDKRPIPMNSFIVWGDLYEWEKYHYNVFIMYYQPAFLNSFGEYIWMEERDDILLPGQDELNKRYEIPLYLKVFGETITSIRVPHRLHFSYSKRQGLALKQDYGIDLKQYSEYLKDLEALLNNYVLNHPEVDSIDFFSPVYSTKKRENVTEKVKI